MDNPEEIRKIANQRLEEAEILLENNMFNGAFYLAGYSVELYLKAKICEVFNIPNLFNFDDDCVIYKIGRIKKLTFTHDLNELILLSGLHYKIINTKKDSAEFSANISFILEKWDSNVRYRKQGYIKKEQLKQIISFLNDKEKGLLQWINKN